MNDRGFVLINALIVVAALAGVSVLVLREAGDGLGRIEALPASQRRETALDAASLLVRRLLREDMAATGIDHGGEAWALVGYRTDVAEVPLSLTVTDLQGRFNLNLLLAEDTAAATVVQALCLAAGWDEADTTALLAAFARRRPPPDAPVRPAASVFASDEVVLAEELVAEGISAEAMASLAGQVSFLPRAARVNVNTAPAEVIAALAGGADRAAVAQFEALRTAAPFADAEAFRAGVAATLGADAAARMPEAILSVSSDWFLAEATARIDSQPGAAAYLLHRTDTGVDVVARIPGDG